MNNKNIIHIDPCPGCPFGPACLAVERGHRPLCQPKYAHARQLHAAGLLGKPETPPTPRPKGLKRELVVARYNEDLGWVSRVPGWHVSVYNKGFDHVPGSVRLPNSGREAGTYLDHFVRNYHDLAEWTVLCQGTPHNWPLEDFLGRLDVEYSDTTSLTAEYMPDFPSPKIKAKDIVEWHGGYETRLGLVNPDEPEWCEAANLPTRQVWETFFTSTMPDPFLFGYAAQLMVPRSRIIARPLEHWTYLRDRAITAGSRLDKDPFNAWAFEMVWLYLLGDAEKYPLRLPVEPVEKPKIRKMSQLEAVRAGLIERPKLGGCRCGN